MQLISILTLTFESLPKQPIQQSTTVITKGGGHVVVHFKLMRDINVKSFSEHLKQEKETFLILQLVVFGFNATLTA